MSRQPRSSFTLRRWFVTALEARTAPAVVTNLDDAGPGSLRQAILDTNASSTDNAISFSVTGTVLLQSVLPTVDDDLTITGPGATALTVKRDAGFGSFRILNVANAAKVLNVALSGMTFSNGSAIAANQFDNGGALNIGSESVSLTGMVISGNTSNQEGGGIGVAKAGVLTITDSTISGNTATGTSGSSAAGGSGGGVYFAYDGQLTLKNSTISGNVAANRGGGLYLYAAGTANWLIQNSTFSGNKTTSIVGSGGAISLNTNPTGTNNLTVQNSTIFQNTAGSFGSGGGIFASGKSPTSLESTIVSNNAASSGPDLSNSTSANKFTAKNCAIFSTAGTNSFTSVSGNLIGKTLNLGALAFNNGGQTRTHLPAANSPVIDAGTNPASLPADQNALARSYDDAGAAGSGPDIGAVEVQPFGLPTGVASSADVATAGPGTHTITVTYDDALGTNNGIKVASLGTGDITVSGPGGFTATPTYQGVDVGSNGRPRTATYTFTPPGGTWNDADVGAYSIAIAAGQVQDLDGNSVPAGAAGGFVCRVPRTFVVTTTADTGAGSLRAALDLANDPAIAPSADSITFNLPPASTITLASQFTITDSVNIIGPGAGDLTLDGAGAVRHFVIDGVGTLAVTISGMTLQQGKTTGGSINDRGGSIQINDENVTLDGVTMIGNATNVRGGAISLQGPGTLIFQNGKLQDNTSGTGFVGGAINSDAPGHTIIVRDSNISGNTADKGGGAVYSVGGNVTIERCNVFNNGATGDGGALLLGNQFGSSKLTVLDSAFFGNNALGQGQGGAIALVGDTLGVLIRNSTISGNTAAGTTGGGIVFGFLGGPVLIQNSTITVNKAVAASGISITLGVTPGTVTMDSTILAANIGDPLQPDLQGKVLATNCLVGVVDGFGAELAPGSANNQSGTDTAPLDPQLQPLNLNGGTTLTHALAASSPARDTGINPAALTNDQRGAGFPRQLGTAVDIGAFEAQPTGITAAKVTGVQINDGSAQRSRVISLTITFDNPLTLPGTPADAFQLKRNSDSANVTLAANVTGNSVTLTFTGGAVDFGSLADGRYTLTILAAQAPNIDGNGDGTAGDDYQLIGDPAIAPKLYRLFGDADGDNDVDTSDFGAFRTVFGGTSGVFDFDNDGDVDTSDFGAFRQRFGASI